MRSEPSALGLVLVMALGVGSGVCASAQTTTQEPKTVEVKDLNETPERFADVEVLVTGRLTAEGNYFSRNRRVFLVGKNEKRIEVLPWLPLSAPPPRSETDKPPATLTDYLDRDVELRGVLRRITDDPAAKTDQYKFNVKSARILSR